MATQKSVKQATKEKRLDLTYWAEGVVKRLKTNFDTQNIFPYGYPGPYPGAARKQTKDGKFEGSTGDAFRSIYAKVYNAAGGNTEKISFFFNYYGEMITYLCMTAPIALMAVVSWIRNPSKENKNEVA